MREKNAQIDLREYERCKAVISTITLLEDNNFVDYYCVKIKGLVFSNGSGDWKFKSREDALRAKMDIKNIIKDKLKANQRGEK